jgi:hypothetical protein
MKPAEPRPERTFARRAEDLIAPQTQIVADRDTYLGQNRNDVGRRISDDQFELFISSDVASALRQEFTLHAPEFVALHDVGTSASLRLLSSMAGAARSKVQQLAVRRQGQGVALAVLQFVEVPLADGTPVRVYATDINADSATRTQVARVLLAHSRLGVLLVGELPPHVLNSQLEPLTEALEQGPWPNRDLLMVPLGSGTALAARAKALAGYSPVQVHVAPHANKPRQVWNFIGGAWNRLHSSPSGAHALPTELALAVPPQAIPPSEAATQPMELRPLPASVPSTTRTRPMPQAGATPWQAYADQCALIPGSLSCCIFDRHSMKALAHAGAAPPADRLAQQGSLLLVTMENSARALGLGDTEQEASISTSAYHLLLRPVPGHPGVAVHLVLSASTTKLVLARMQLERIAPPA